MEFYEKCRGSLFHPGGFDLTKRAVSYCGFSKGAVIADIGCGEGETGKLIEASFPVTVLNIEPSAAMSRGNPAVINAYAEKLPFENVFLDGALCECVLSLCEDIEASLRELYRVIKHSGLLIITDVYSKSELFSASGAVKWFYPKEKICAYLKNHGFEVLLFEDHSRELAKMAAKLIFEGTYNETVYKGVNPKNTGYFMLIAKKH